jgi:sialic acid synthase SpsE
MQRPPDARTTAPAKAIEIAGRQIARGAPVYIVAEMACGHQGRASAALDLVDAAAAAGANAVQLQLFDAPHNMSARSPVYETIRGLQLNGEDWGKIFSQARSRRLAVIAYVYDRSSLELALTLGPDALKLNASDLSNPELLDPIARSGLPFTLGTGASTMEEIAESLNFVQDRGGTQVVLMHGVQNFPTPLADANISRLRVLRDAFDTLVGYADHTAGDDPMAAYIDLVALGAGACMLEKHIIGDRKAEGVDRQAALEPEEFRGYVARMRAASAALGPDRPMPLGPAEDRYRRFQKKVAVAARDIAAGTAIRRTDLVFLRHPDPGLSPFEAERVVGRAAARDIAKDDAIRSEMVSVEGE